MGNKGGGPRLDRESEKQSGKQGAQINGRQQMNSCAILNICCDPLKGLFGKVFSPSLLVCIQQDRTGCFFCRHTYTYFGRTNSQFRVPPPPFPFVGGRWVLTVQREEAMGQRSVGKVPQTSLHLQNLTPVCAKLDVKKNILTYR